MPRTPARDRPGPRDLEIVESHRRRTDAGSFHWKDVAKAFRRQRCSCYYCGLPFPYFRTRGKPGIRTSWFQIEHKTPISRGGTNDPANLCLACKTCNRLKGTKTEEEFLRGKPPGYLENLTNRRPEESKPQRVDSGARGQTRAASEGGNRLAPIPLTGGPCRSHDETSRVPQAESRGGIRDGASPSNA